MNKLLSQKKKGTTLSVRYMMIIIMIRIKKLPISRRMQRLKIIFLLPRRLRNLKMKFLSLVHQCQCLMMIMGLMNQGLVMK